jgi:molybdopterin-containing oxidoreductase family iron-sulfur binding subunit
MMNDKLWKTFQQQDSQGEPAELRQVEGSRIPPQGISRRTFIEMIGFSAAALAFSSCRPPEEKIIPYLKQPVEFTPGVASWFASTCGGCSAGCGVLIKVRDGRPIKLEGNPEHPLSGGGLCAVAHAMVFGLYDSDRLRQPLIGSKPSTWDEVDRQIRDVLAATKKTGEKVRVLTNSISSPTSRQVIAQFLSQFKDGKHVVYEPVSAAAIRQAHERTHGLGALPQYRFDKAKLVVSFSADFLGTWLIPTSFAKQYSAGRDLRQGQREMLRHVQFESLMSLTGSNADSRIRVSPAEELQALMFLAELVNINTGAAGISLFAARQSRLSEAVRQAVQRLATELLKLRGQSLVVSGSNDADTQCIVNFINHALGNYGETLDLNAPSEQKQGTDREMIELVREMNAGEVGALIISGANPAYDYYNSEQFASAIAKVPLKVSLNPMRDETSALVDYVCPTHHFLEAWDDAEPVRGVFSLNQPAIAPLFQTRAYQESLMRWSGDRRSFYDVLRQSWKEKLFPLQKEFRAFDEFWDRSLQDGFAVLPVQAAAKPAFVAERLSETVERLKARSATLENGLSALLYEKIGLRNGAHANNPWLHELPDPISKITWDNYACVSPKLAAKLGLEEGMIIRVAGMQTSIELPAHIQVGQHDDCVGIALGYGRTRAGKAGTGVGVNAYPLVSFENGTFQYQASGINIQKTPAKVQFASTQLHQTLDGRPLIKEFTLDDYLKERGKQAVGPERESRSIWKDYQYGEHKWAMVVDLNACTGCSACILSCQAENNVPVVGKDEVRRQREMHWIRLDRYVEGSDDATRISYQPVMCSQCDNASCESVCPVLATVHSSEGLNMQVYNRCVGTRYCENNCAYKVRRFNWFENRHDDPVANLALNPDVTVRTRGVMEKCTFCVQRIEEAKIRARNEGRAIGDGEIQTACQQSCPARAITFGDLVDADSKVGKLKHDQRDYILLEELNLRPQISYLGRVRNTGEFPVPPSGGSL